MLDLLQGIHCLHNEIVMDVMWGMQRHMHRLVPMEKSELPKEDRVPMSQGLQMLLSRHGFHVKPKMVSLPVAIAFPLVLADALGILHFQTRALSAIFFLFPFAFFFGDEAALFVSR